MKASHRLKPVSFAAIRLRLSAARVAMSTLIIPSMVVGIYGSDKEIYLATIVALTIAIGLPHHFLSGFLVDLSQKRGFPREIILGLGISYCILGAALSWWASSFLLLSIVAILISSGVLTLESSHGAMINLNFDAGDHSRVSSWITKYSLLGGLIGPFVPLVVQELSRFHSLFSEQTYPISILILVFLFTFLSLPLFKRRNHTSKTDPMEKGPNLLELLTSSTIGMKRFRFVSIARILAMVPAITLPSFLLFFRQDVGGDQNPHLVTGISSLVYTLGGVAGIALFKKFLHKNLGVAKSQILAISVMILALILIIAEIMFHSLFWYPAIVIFGVGFALYFSFSLSFGLSIVEELDWSGTLLSIYTSTTFCAYFIGTVITGTVLASAKTVGLSFAYALVGAAYILSLFLSAVLLAKDEKFFQRSSK